MKTIARLAALAALGLAATTGHADDFRVSDPVVTVEDGQIGLVLHGSAGQLKVARVLQPGTHAKTPLPRRRW